MLKVDPELGRRGQGVVVGKVPYTILRDPNGNRYSLVLYRNDDGTWHSNYTWLDNERNADNHAALLAPRFISPLGVFPSGVFFCTVG